MFARLRKVEDTLSSRSPKTSQTGNLGAGTGGNKCHELTDRGKYDRRRGSEINIMEK
jgi:hypothetical protein